MQLTKIDWPWKPLATWNPVTGCRRGCSWCYARRIHERFHKTPFSDIVFHPERLKEKPCAPHVFVGSMSDIEYWMPGWVMKIQTYCAEHIDTQFYFLSKNPAAYLHFLFPKNCVLGLTITSYREHEKNAVVQMQKYPRTFLSIEPLLGEIGLVPFDNDFERVIVGQMTGPGAVKPRQEWIDSIKRNVPAEKLYWKNNIREASHG